MHTKKKVLFFLSLQGNELPSESELRGSMTRQQLDSFPPTELPNNIIMVKINCV